MVKITIRGRNSIEEEHGHKLPYIRLSGWLSFESLHRFHWSFRIQSTMNSPRSINEHHHTQREMAWILEGVCVCGWWKMIIALAKHGINCKLHKAASEVDKTRIRWNEKWWHKKMPILILLRATCEQALIWWEYFDGSNYTKSTCTKERGKKTKNGWQRQTKQQFDGAHQVSA